ncbi:uncharacterized protein BCR38DRAFT_524664 [Pseudomassariella vexata]|uniref:Uncharacterized protein n=1 Tax=Pseudomassariella vexata TaxID=1141098 RepID=A0A1Y2DV54_9PEZI|nr:uncharacterized protein BCR38DRAFT_524664 [Pseudomassariella vexata]ORY63014.1 hypothetical protein BCR38DRAFT_524664 [Pseudomassariella vexata]
MKSVSIATLGLMASAVSAGVVRDLINTEVTVTPSDNIADCAQVEDIRALGPPDNHHYFWHVEQFLAIYKKKKHHKGDDDREENLEENLEDDVEDDIYPSENRIIKYKYEFDVTGPDYEDCNYNIPDFVACCDGHAVGRPSSEWEQCKLKVGNEERQSVYSRILHHHHHRRDVEDDSEANDQEDQENGFQVTDGDRHHHHKKEAFFAISYTYYQPWHHGHIHWNYTSYFKEYFTKKHHHEELKEFALQVDHTDEIA